jgi:glycosyltransferase involved in cell wall biosynthesis
LLRDVREGGPFFSLGKVRMRISLVTLTLNCPQFIEETFGRIKSEGPFELEHIVVHDGDEAFSCELKKRHPSVIIIKGEGKGATAAAARAVDAATGDFILFLHSDDRLGPTALTRLAACAAARPEVEIWTGGARIFRTLDDGRELTVRWLISWDLCKLSLENVCDNIPLLMARFCRRSLFDRIGNFDPAFSESSDREFMLRALMAKAVEAPLETLVSEMRQHEYSRTIRSRLDWMPPYLVEHVRIADEWLARSGLDRGVRRFLRNWRAREILRLGLYQWRAGRWAVAAKLLMWSEAMDPLWIFRAFTAFGAHRRRLQSDNPGPGPGGASFGAVESTR